jgi:nitrite reductase [NAD(P)H] small subunit
MKTIASSAARIDNQWGNGTPPTPLVDLGPAGFIPLGEGRAFVVNETTIAVFRQRDGRLFATDNTCPHRGGPLADGIVGGGKVICPLHAWKFDLETGHCPAENVVIRTYPVRVVGGRIVLEVSPRSQEAGE